MSDDFTQDTRTTGVVSVGAGATGELETRGDIDWFEVTLQAGQDLPLRPGGVPDRRRHPGGSLFAWHLRQSGTPDSGHR